DRDALGLESRRGGRAAVAREPWLTAACEGADPAVGIDAADAVVLGVGDVDAPVCGDGDSARRVQLRLRRWAAVAGVALRPRSGDSGDDAVRVHTPDPVVVAIGDVDAAVRAQRDPVRAPSRLGWRAA